MRNALTLFMVTTITLLTAILAPAPQAQACGGFFCSQVPIDQVGEQIIFGVEGEKVSATIMIQYAGDAKDFAWVVPVASIPDVKLGAWELFTNLGWATNPNYYLQWDYENGDCGWMMMPESSMDDADFGSGGGGNGVEVVAEDEVGPYDYVVLKSEDAQELWEWLSENGFDQPENSVPLIAHYLDEGMYFLALKLKQDAGAGDVQPVTLIMEENAPCVPLVLTQIAAQPNMPVLAWIFGGMRAIPTNWFHVLLNEKKIDWLGYGQNYEEILTQAVDEAAGHGFVTEYAGDSSVVSDVYYEERCSVSQLEILDEPQAFLQKMLNLNCPRDATSQALIKQHIPKPEGLPEGCQSDQEFYTWNLEECLQHMPEDWIFDGAAMAADVQTKIVDPLLAAQALLDTHGYVTRLYTTVSPDEMNRDPFFAFNPELEDISNQHTAMATAECTEDGTVTNVVITLENGETLTLEGEIDLWGGPESGGDMAPDEGAAAQIELLSASGPGQVVPRSAVKTIDERLNHESPEIVFADLESGLYTEPEKVDPSAPSPGTDGAGTGAPNTTNPPAATTAGDSGSDSGCAGGEGSDLPWAIGLSLLAIAIVRRRL
jgi:hypothetical protein